MSTEYHTRMMTFTEKDLPDLDEVVLGSLEYLSTVTFPDLNVYAHDAPLVVGSGNALQTGKILFYNTNARFSEEGNAHEMFSRDIYDALYIISASGGKHAIMLAQKGVASGIPTYLVTTNEHSPAANIVGRDMTFTYPHIREPYTYNTSTYLSMLFGMKKESPEHIMSFIEEHVAPAIPNNLKDFNAFLLTVPPKFKTIRKMFETKFDELFGPYVAGRSYTVEEVKHAKTVITSDTQCFIHFGDGISLGSPGGRVTIPLPPDCGPAALIAIGYYVIGRIQRAHHPYYKEHIKEYVEEASKLFEQEILVIVE